MATESIFITIFLSLNSTFSLVQEQHNCSILDFVIASSHVTNVHVTEIAIELFTAASLVVHLKIVAFAM